MGPIVQWSPSSNPFSSLLLAMIPAGWFTPFMTRDHHRVPTMVKVPTEHGTKILTIDFAYRVQGGIRGHDWLSEHVAGQPLYRDRASHNAATFSTDARNDTCDWAVSQLISD